MGRAIQDMRWAVVDRRIVAHALRMHSVRSDARGAPVSKDYVFFPLLAGPFS